MTLGDDVTIIEYTLGGATCAEAAEDLQVIRLVATELHEHDAYTDWRYVVGEVEDGGIAILHRAVVRLPRLSAEAGAELQGCFATWRAALEEHERWHVENGRQATEAVKMLIPKRLPRRQFLKMSGRIEAQHRAHDRDFDRETDHGGPACRFPPPTCTHVGRS